MWLLIAFIAIPLIEIGLFIQVGGAIGLFPTLAIVLLTAVIGTMMIRGQGSLVLKNIQSSLNDLRDPTEPLAHGAMILFAGALLLTPGFFTDAIGFALLIPSIRTFVFSHLKTRLKMRNTNQSDFRSSVIIDTEYSEVDPQAEPSSWKKD